MSPSLQIEIGALVCYAGLTRDINISGKQASQEPSSSHRKPFSMGFCRRLSSQQVRRRSVLLRLHPSQINCMHSSHCDDIAIRAAPAVSHAGPCDVVSCAQASPLRSGTSSGTLGPYRCLLCSVSVLPHGDPPRWCLTCSAQGSTAWLLSRQRVHGRTGMSLKQHAERLPRAGNVYADSCLVPLQGLSFPPYCSGSPRTSWCSSAWSRGATWAQLPSWSACCTVGCSS